MKTKEKRSIRHIRRIASASSYWQINIRLDQVRIAKLDFNFDVEKALQF
jgi:hypothetical protein